MCLFQASLGSLQLTEELPHIEAKQFFDEEKDPGHPKTILHMHGFPANQEIHILEKRLAQTKKDEYEREITHFISTGRPDEDIFGISSRGYLPGEKVSFLFKTTGEGFQYEFSLIPNPIEVRNKAGEVVLEAQLMVISPTLYSVKLHRLNENEHLKMISKSGKEVIKNDLVYREKDAFAIMPGVVDKKGGVCRVEFSRQSGEKIKVKLPWGIQFLEYLKGKKIYKP